MTARDHYTSPEAFVADNREMLVRILRHSNNAYARACAWAILDAGSDAPDFETLQRELAVLQEQQPV